MVGQTNGITDEDKKKIKEPSKLVLCFDGTGNAFSGTESDTNIVKLYQKFDRTAPNQYHYYQRECLRFANILQRSLILPPTQLALAPM